MKEKKIPIKTIHLFSLLDKMLIELLKSLNQDQWNHPTIARLWTVKDIAAHLLDGNLRAISTIRDGYFGEKPANVHSYTALVHYLNTLNHSWVAAAKRLSPKVIIQLLETSGKQYCKMLKKLPPHDEAVFPVAWAGQEVSPNWFHIAREYTEKFLHQQQIRDAVGQQALFSKKFYRPFLDTFMQALPYSYRNVHADTGTVVTLMVPGKAGGKWSIMKIAEGWSLIKKTKGTAAAIITIEPDIAWQLFSKSKSPAEAEQFITITGNRELGLVAAGMVAVMA